MAERIISEANLSAIENNLQTIHENIAVLNSNINEVDNHVDTVEGELAQLTVDFHQFVQAQNLANRAQTAETRLVKIRQEQTNRFGHYELIRRTTTGILQATDLGIVRQDVIQNATEELMLSTPGYWLAPCLVALSAWITDQQELAQKALKEAIKRDDEKTSLFFSLLCRRADRKLACIKWVQRYLAGQDEENLDRKAILVLSAYANGLWGNDAEGKVIHQIQQWLQDLTTKPGFVEQQSSQWKEAIFLHRRPLADADYTYLKRYTSNWPVLESVMQGAELHANLYDYFEKIFEQKGSNASLTEQLDEILMSLVSDFDDEELPLRKKEKLEQLVIDFQGDEKTAQQHMQVEKTAFETHKDFTQLLTDASMNPETSHADAATQKFAIALSRDWIVNAYNDVIAENRSKIPHEISLQIDNFLDTTVDGTNEEDILRRFSELIDREKQNILATAEMSSMDIASKYIGIGLMIFGVILLVTGMFFYGIVAGIVGYFTHKHYRNKKAAWESAKQHAEQLEDKRTNGSQIIRASLAEVVDYRRIFAEKDKESQKVVDFLQQLQPDQFVNRLAGESKRIVLQPNGEA